MREAPNIPGILFKWKTESGITLTPHGTTPLHVEGDAGDTIKYHRYFLVCDYHMSQNHTWNKAPFPKSETKHATYIVNRRLVFNNSADFWREARK